MTQGAAQARQRGELLSRRRHLRSSALQAAPAHPQTGAPQPAGQEVRKATVQGSGGVRKSGSCAGWPACWLPPKTARTWCSQGRSCRPSSLWVVSRRCRKGASAATTPGVLATLPRPARSHSIAVQVAGIARVGGAHKGMVTRSRIWGLMLCLYLKCMCRQMADAVVGLSSRRPGHTCIARSKGRKQACRGRTKTGELAILQGAIEAWAA